MKTGIIGAVKEEVDLLVRSLRESNSPVRETHLGSMEFFEGKIANAHVVICRCGVGKVHAAMCAQVLISGFSVDRVINTGAAGGLDDRLSLFDIIVSIDAVQHDFDVTSFGYKPGCIPGFTSPFFIADPGMRLTALNAFAEVIAQFPQDSIKPSVYEGRVATGDVFVANDIIRAELRERFSPVCVEMEGAAIAQVCAAYSIPFVILRSISDLAGDTANVSYDDFSEQASKMSALLVIEMLQLLQ
ncbi:MAG TPA: 5'-methylthioadenosine/adenosylhomocysteine nucleosidase [Treponema sp.]|nr:5'-methylthioadenosine/adenosylhomocysteine nucleosidase [Treponema sp.]